MLWKQVMIAGKADIRPSSPGSFGGGNPDFSLNVGPSAGALDEQVGAWILIGPGGPCGRRRDAMFWKIVGALIVAWVAFMVLGSVIGFLFKAVLVIAIIAGVGILGAATYRAIKGGDNRKQIR
jgi:hypothetical protein